ncbi:MAG: hypothetical protein NC209_07585 [Alistipes sp.]|nr:hypothetical protein [Alistipes senegalensis]MCM1250986.1 hypothetical protein [Alistipes sp.]
MKKIFRLFLSAAAGFVLGACTPDAPELPEMTFSAEDLVMGEAYTITQDADDPNTVYLASLLKGVTPLWEYPGGRSQKSEVKLQIAFKGQYTFRFGVMTPGGYVYGEPYVLDLTTDNFAYVENELWTCLSGGRGKSKTWVLDLDAEGNTTYFKGPKWFFANGYTWDAVHKADGSCYLDMSDYAAAGYAECIAPYIVDGASAWYWAADWAGNSWMCGAADYGTMTFDLIDGANCTVVDANGNEIKGSYILDADSHTIAFTDVVMLNPDGMTANPASLRLIALDDYRLQIAAVPDPPYTAPDDPSMTVYNFVTKEYFDNPPAPEEPKEPELPEGWKDIVGQITQTAIKWTLSTENPLDWCTLSGGRMNGWNSPSDYPDWLGTPDPAVYGDFSLTMDSSTGAYVAVAPDGSETAGSYSLDDKGVYKFDNGLPSFTLIGWASFATTDDNELRIMSIETAGSGTIRGMWLGAKAADKDEYTAYHLIANVGSGDSAEGESGYDASIYFTNSSWWPSGNGAVVKITGDGTYTCEFAVEQQVTDAMVFTVDIAGLRKDHPAAGAAVKAVRCDGQEIAFDAAKVAYGDLEGNGNLRLELANAFGPTSGDPAVAAVDFSQKIEVDFEVKFEAYEAQIMITNSGWWPSYSGATQAGVLGVGKYLIGLEEMGDAITAPMIFCIDVLGYPDAATAKCGIHSIEVNGEKVTVKAGNLAYGDLEKKGNLRWEFFNIYGDTKGSSTDSALDYSQSVIDGSEFTEVKSLKILVSIDE